MKKLLGLGLGAALALSPLVALASVQFDNIAPVVFDNGSGWEANVDGNGGDSVRAKVIVDITSDDDVNAVSWDYIGDFLPKECVQLPAELTQTQLDAPIEFDMKLPVAVGSYDTVFTVYGNNGPELDFNCTNAVDTETVNDRVIVNIASSNTGGSTGGGSGTVGGSVLPWQASIDALNAKIAALMSSLTSLTTLVGSISSKPACPPSGDTSMVQTWLMSNGYGAGFYAAGVHAATGYWGPITTAAYAQATAACK